MIPVSSSWRPRRHASSAGRGHSNATAVSAIH